MDGTTLFRIADGVTWDHSDDQVVILNPDGSQMITLNDVGSVLWPELRHPVDVDRLVAALQVRFQQVDPGDLSDDVLTFLDELEEEGLVSRQSG